MLVNNTGGGGRHGHPFARRPVRVARGARNGFVSAEAAARDYRVVVEELTFEVDATEGSRHAEPAA